MDFSISRPLSARKEQTQSSLFCLVALSLDQAQQKVGALLTRLAVAIALLAFLWCGAEVEAGFLAAPEVEFNLGVRNGISPASSLLSDSVVALESEVAGAGASEVTLDPDQVSEKAPVGPTNGIPISLGFSALVGISTSGRSSAGAPEPSVGGSVGSGFAFCEAANPLKPSLWVTKLFSADNAVLPLVPPPDVFRPPPIAV